MPKCWAKSLGDCDNTQSGEHVLTAGLFDSPLVTIHGLPWCANQPKTIGIQSLKSNILCKHHNETLSRVDELAISIFKAIGDAIRIRTDRSIPYWRRIFDSRLFERWLVKTLLNLVESQKNPQLGWALQKDSGVVPPSILVRSAFGLAELPHPLGFYATARVGQQMHSFDNVSVTTIHHQDEGLAAAFFDFQGATFLLWLHDSVPPVQVTKSYLLELRDVELFRREVNLKIKGVPGTASHVVTLTWK